MYGLPLWLWWTFAAPLAGLGIVITGRALFHDRSRGRRRCPRCWYDMSGANRGPQGWTCPECGRPITLERHLLRTRRRIRLAALGLILMLGAPGVWITEYQDKHGWWSITPTPILMWIAVRQQSQTTTRAQEHLHQRLPYYYRAGPIHDFLVSQAQARLGPNCTMTQRYFGLGSLGILAARGQGLEALLTAAKGQDPGDADVALHALREARPPVEVVASLGRTMLRSPRPGISSDLFQLLTAYANEFSQEDADFFRAHALRFVKADPDDVGAAAAHLLGRLQPLSNATIDDLLTILDQTRHEPRWHSVATTLASCGPSAARAAPILIDRMENGGAGNFTTPVYALGRLGPAAAAAAPALQRAGEQSSFVRFDAECARMAVCGEHDSMLKACISRLDDPNERLAAFETLGRLAFWGGGEDISIARPRVELLLMDPDPAVRHAAVLFMWWLKERAAPSLPAIRAAESDPDPKVRQTATRTIQQIERAAYLMPPATSPRRSPQ